MRRIRGKDTIPELAVRKACRELGFPGYRLHRKDLPGKPDIAYVGIKKAIFVHGCFWHGHNCPEGKRKPKSNQNYWLPKIQRNIERDREHLDAMVADGWSVMIVWECELPDSTLLKGKLAHFLAG